MLESVTRTSMKRIRHGHSSNFLKCNYLTIRTKLWDKGNKVQKAQRNVCLMQAGGTWHNSEANLDEW